MTAIVRDHRTHSTSSRPEVRDHRTEGTSRPVVRDHRTESTQNRGNYEWKGDHWERTRASSSTRPTVQVPPRYRDPVMTAPPPSISQGYPTTYQPVVNSSTYASGVNQAGSIIGGSGGIYDTAGNIAATAGTTLSSAEASIPPGLRDMYNQLKKDDPEKAKGFLMQQMMENLKYISELLTNISKAKSDILMSFARNLK